MSALAVATATVLRHRRPRHARPWRAPVIVVFGAICVVASAIRFATLIRGGAPPTIDSGNWLAFGHAMLGEHIRSTSIVYPPVVPALVTAAVWLFGATHGVALAAVVASLAPGLGVFVALRVYGLHWMAVALAGLLVMAASTGEATAWGGFPQLLGIGAMVFFLIRLDIWSRRPSLPAALVAGLALADVAATSDIVFGAALVAGAVVIILRVSVCAPSGRVTNHDLLVGIALIAAPVLPFAPLYAHIGGAVVHSLGSRPTGARLGVRNVPSRVEFLYRDFVWFWRPVFIATVLTPLLLADRRREPVWVATTALLVTSGATAIVLGEDRFLYFLTPAMVLALGAWCLELGRHEDVFFRRAEAVVGALICIGFVVQSFTGLSLFRQQRRYYGILDPGLVAGISWIEEHTPRRAVVAVPPIRNAPLGWWVEGLGRRRTLLATPLRWLNYPDERRRASEANAIFSQAFPDAASLHLARADGADYLLLPLSSEVLDADRVSSYVAAHPEAVAFQDPTTVVVSLGG